MEETPNSQSGRKPYDIRERTFELALRTIRIVGELPRNGPGWRVADQLSRCGPSVGANVEEADGAVSKADKRKALIIARKEIRESRYWLRIIDRLWGDRLAVNADVDEATEILRILSSIILKLS